MITHTPGPWRADEPGIADDFCDRRVGIFDAGPGNPGIIAEVYAYLNPGTMKANARLIAAAPELLAALRYILALQATDKLPFPLIALDQARAAIAKATGETP